jgi:hypothetical protein
MTTVDYPGSALGLPKTGPGSVASMGLRIGAFALDLVVSFLVLSPGLRCRRTGACGCG